MKKLFAFTLYVFLVFSMRATAQNVGIGTLTPSEKLEVNGNIKISGSMNLNGNTGQSGQVLISQGNNPPTWIDPSALVKDPEIKEKISQASPELFTGDIVLKSSGVADKWYDGIGLVSFRDTLFAFGGWYTSDSTGSSVINSIRYSADDGATWVLSNSVLPFSGHSFLYFKSPDGWLYIIGGDNFNIPLLQTVWRTKDMKNFTVMTSNAGWGPRTLMGGWADENNNIYVAGGQTTTDVSTGPNDIWRSSNGGASWTRIANNINLNGEYFLGQNIINQVKLFNGRVYLVGGGISAATPYDTYSSKVFSASIDDLSNWRREKDLPCPNGKRYAGVEVWDGKLWVWSGHNSLEGNLKNICYMDNSGNWHDFKYTFTDNDPNRQVSPTHAAGITVHKDMLYRVLGNYSNEAYAIKRSSFFSSLHIRDTLITKNLVISSLQGSGNRLAQVGPSGELLTSNLSETNLLTTDYDFSIKNISNQVASPQAANLWISGQGIFGGGINAGKALQVNGESFFSGNTGFGTTNPNNYLAGVSGITIYNPTATGLSLANAGKYWLTWINNNDLKFYEGGAGINRLSIKAGGVINIDNLAGTGTRMVVTDDQGNLSSQAMIIPGEVNTASNLGNAAFGLFKQKSGTDLQFRSLSVQADGGIDLVSGTNDVQLKNNAYFAYGKVEITTTDGTTDVLIKTISPPDNSVGSLEVDMVGISNSLDAITGKKYVPYKKMAGVITLGPVTDLVGTNADGPLGSADWTISENGGNLEIRVTGVSSRIIKWKPLYKLNEVH